MQQELISLPSFSCLRCGHSWHPRSTQKPMRCARCGTPYWDRPRAAGTNRPKAKRAA
jgi:hypothetical protein